LLGREVILGTVGEEEEVRWLRTPAATATTAAVAIRLSGSRASS
jgi:hypothetical protein